MSNYIITTGSLDKPIMLSIDPDDTPTFELGHDKKIRLLINGARTLPIVKLNVVSEEFEDKYDDLRKLI